MKAKALVIGNANYSESKLENPINDASDMGAILKRLGFEVEILTDANRIELDSRISDFAKSLDRYQTGVFYFAGHGFQINNENYLAAIDTSVEDEPHAKHTSFPLNILLHYLSEAKNDSSIIILDACRNNLTQRSWYRGVQHTGLASILAPKGTLIAFATSPGHTAADGVGTRNGVYTGALLKHISVQNLPIEEMFKRVRSTVLDASHGKQISWEHTSLTVPFSFNNGQLAHSSSIEYATYALHEATYELNKETAIDLAIQNLKSHSRTSQEYGMEQILNLDCKEEDKNKLFLVGRSVLQAAENGCKRANQFMKDLPNSVNPYQNRSKNHVLNGIAYDTFFDSNGIFRQQAIKHWFLENLFEALEKKTFRQSLNFIVGILDPYREKMFYIPTINRHGITVDLKFSKPVSKRYALMKIKYKGHDVLKRNENEFWKVDEQITYDYMNYHELSKRIAYFMQVPLNKLKLNSNFPMSEETLVAFPSGHAVFK